MVDHFGHLHTLLAQLVSLLLQLYLVVDLEGEVDHAATYPEPPVDAGIEVRRDSRDLVALHEGDQLVVPHVEKRVADGSAGFWLDHLAHAGLEAQHVLVEVEGRLHVVGGESQMVKTLRVAHGFLPLTRADSAWASSPSASASRATFSIALAGMPFR